jgi:hypothetical protein
MTPRIQELALQGVDSNQIKREARREGMRTLREDGAQKVLRGETTIEEIMRVTRDDILKKSRTDRPAARSRGTPSHMPVYEYKAMARATGKNSRGVIDAESAAQARQKLRDQDLYPTSLAEAAAGATGPWPRRKGR